MGLARTENACGDGERGSQTQACNSSHTRAWGPKVSSQFVNVTGANKLLQPSDSHGYRHCEQSFLGRKLIRLHLRAQRQRRTPSADTFKSQGRTRFMRLEKRRSMEDVPKA